MGHFWLNLNTSIVLESFGVSLKVFDYMLSAILRY